MGNRQRTMTEAEMKEHNAMKLSEIKLEQVRKWVEKHPVCPSCLKSEQVLWYMGTEAYHCPDCRIDFYEQ